MQFTADFCSESPCTVPHNYVKVGCDWLQTMAGALSADDRLLGEKMDYYCSSSEDEGERENDGVGDTEEGPKKSNAAAAPSLQPHALSGSSRNVSCELVLIGCWYLLLICNIIIVLLLYYYCYY